ncbi:ATP synthase F0 subunit B [Erysipelothrix urinaevulpis]|uniref:ATP synthase F0 subunit B n=1 Tax=Erysipelothrix urinaevulpis TaxID=2683717 RepID=UPI00135906AD|nr:ATP synthase F0 subunit B [Erysipelothrix urinaevulpis]
MDIDIANLLFPNIVTMIVQLLATGVIFLMYRKYLNEPVQDYLEKRADLIESEVTEAQALRINAEQTSVKALDEYQEAMERIKTIEADMIHDAQARKKEIIASAQVEIDRREAQLEQDYQEEREALFNEAQQYVLEAAVEVNRKVLEDIQIDQAQMVKALEKEMDSHDYKH